MRFFRPIIDFHGVVRRKVMNVDAEPVTPLTRSNGRSKPTGNQSVVSWTILVRHHAA